MDKENEKIKNKSNSTYENELYNENVDSISNDSLNEIKEDNCIDVNENHIDNSINNQYKDKKTNDIKKEKLTIKSINDTILFLIFLILLFLFALLETQQIIPKWEYKTINLEATNQGLYTTNNFNSTKIELTENMINEYGLEGWELIDTYLEMETVHPNYGDSEYVTGLQPNIRPQRLVLIFKRPYKFLTLIKSI